MTRKTGALARLEADGLIYWEHGWTDPMIGKKFGCVKGLVCMWRKRHGLACNAPSGSEDWTACQVKRLKKGSDVLQLHEDGWSDAQGAKILGITIRAYNHRRRRLGLLRNKRRKDDGSQRTD